MTIKDIITTLHQADNASDPVERYRLVRLVYGQLNLEVLPILRSEKVAHNLRLNNLVPENTLNA